MLRTHLHQTSPELLPELYTRAAKWLEREGDSFGAVQYLLKGRLYDLAAHQIERIGFTLLTGGSWGQLLDWLRQLPGGLVRNNPILALDYAWGLALTGQMEEIDQRIADVERVIITAAEAGSQGSLPDWQGQLSAVRGRVCYFRGDSVLGH